MVTLDVANYLKCFELTVNTLDGDAVIVLELKEKTSYENFQWRNEVPQNE